jgi:hypothetical protein
VDPPGGGGGGSHGQIRRRQLLPPLLASLPRVDLPGGGGHGQIRRRRHLLRVDPATAASSAASLLPPARWSRVDPTVVASTEGGSGNGGFLRRLSSPSGAMVVPDGGSGGRGVNFCDVCYSCCYSWMWCMLLLFLDDFVMLLFLDVVYVVVLGCLWLMWLIFLGRRTKSDRKKITRMDQSDCDDRKNTNIYISYRYVYILIMYTFFLYKKYIHV